MARPSTPPLLSEQRTSSPASQVKALKQLKNEVIGHEQRKQYWVRWGLLKPLVRFLKPHKNDEHASQRNGAGDDVGRGRTRRTYEEEAKLQAIIIVGSLAHGGPAFIPPLHASGVYPCVLSLLSSEESPDIILQALRTLNHFSESICLATPETREDGFIDALYTVETLRNLAILIMEREFGGGMPQVELIASLISKTCNEEWQRKLLYDNCVLEALSAQLKTWIATTFVPQAEDFSLRWEPRLTIHDMMPGDRVRRSVLLHAIGIIVQNSELRAQHLLSACENIFQVKDKQLGDAWNNLTADVPANLKARVSRAPTSAECLLPHVPIVQSKLTRPHAIGYPPLDPIKIIDRPSTRSWSTSVEISANQGLERVGTFESPLIPWLIHMARSSDELISLTTTWLLAILYHLRLTTRTTERSIALLTVPSLVQMLDKDTLMSRCTADSAKGSTSSFISDRIKGDAPAILAILTSNNVITQKAAVDAGAIKKLSKLLKQSYDPVSADTTSPMWSSDAPETDPQTDADEAARIGEAGVTPTTWHVMNIRQSTLLALAALASDKHEYRKAIIDSGVVPFVVRALRAEDVKIAMSATGAGSLDDATIEQKIAQGSCRESILAACNTSRVLSRSVATLRTSLMDAGLAAPLFALMKSQDMAIKIQATAVICNFVLDFSPMRDAMLQEGILDVLFDHAHSENRELRLNSLWALRSIVTNVNMELKIQCIEGLGIHWLKHIISSEAETSSLTRLGEREDGNMTPMRMSTPNAAGEQVDLLNAVDIDSRESSQALEEDGDEDTKMSDSIGSLSKSEDSLKARSRPTKPRPTLTLQDNKNSLHQYSDLPDEIAMIKLGLELIRNITSGPDSTEAIDYIFREFGTDDFFRILASKLRPRVLNAFNGANRKSTFLPSESAGIRHIPPQPEILTSALYCLAHLGASGPRHTMLVMNQPKLLELLLPHFGHPEPEIRAACSWVVFNLVWEHDHDDRELRRERVRKLVELGFYERLREMERDEDLNCKERAKTALQQLQQGSR